MYQYGEKVIMQTKEMALRTRAATLDCSQKNRRVTVAWKMRV